MHKSRYPGPHLHGLNLYKAASDPTYLKRGGADSTPPPPGSWAPKMIATKIYNVNLTIQKIVWGQSTPNWALVANLKFSLIGQFGQKPKFQEFFCGLTKMAIAQSFFDQLTPFFANGS